MALGPCGDIVKTCNVWILNDWDIIINHVPRDRNEIADWLAKFTSCRNCYWIEFQEPPFAILDNKVESACMGNSTGRKILKQETRDRSEQNHCISH